ncbi:MAG: NTP/NDP exchange transporter [Simkaniaceae bacterium]
MSQSTQPEFGKWRSILWPIHNFELKKLLPMLALFFLILFNYTILRDTKDTLIVTANGSGAETITFLKLWGVLPMAILFMIIYSKLSNVLSKKALFYTTVSPFIVFFAIFSTVLYPLRDVLHPNALCDSLQNSLPQGFMGFIAVIRNWTFSLFYIMAELWGSVALSLLFWGFANDTTRTSESKRFYNLFGMGANVALPVSGYVIIKCSNIRNKLPEGVDAWQVSLNLMMGIVVISGLLIMGVYWYINRFVLTDPRFSVASNEIKKKKDKPKMSLKESFLYLSKSKYLGCICILVMAYGLSINIVEVTWKGQLKLQYPNPNEYSAFMGMYSSIMGYVSIIMMLFVGGNMIRRKGWGYAAMFTPIVLLISGVCFFSFIMGRDSLGGLIASLGMSPVMLAVVFGTVQNIMSKSSKYSLFDPTKEMAYIPLDQEQKVKGKAAIDVVGARLGKSGGSFIQMGLILALGSVSAITPYVALILLGVITAWLIAAKSLSKQYTEVSAKFEANEAEEAAETIKVASKTEEAPAAT